MNIVIAILLIFAIIGLIDKILGNRFRLAEEFDKGIQLMGSMGLALIGITCLGVYAAEVNADAIASLSKLLPFDPSVIVGSLLAPDMGGLPISLQIAQSRELGVFSGMLLSTTVGVTVCFQLPVCLSGIHGKENKDLLMKGFIIGLATIPPGIIAGGLLLKMNILTIIINFLPILVLCGIILIGFRTSPGITSGALTLFGNLITMITLVLFAVVMLGIFVPSMAIVDYSGVADVFVAVGRMSCIVCGSLVFSKIMLKVFKKPFASAAGLLKTNEYAVIGLILGLTSSFAMLPLFPKMDTRGKLMNGAFSIGGAYLLGGQMAFVATLTTDWELAVFFIAKIIIGGCAILAAYKLRISDDSDSNKALPQQQ